MCIYKVFIINCQCKLTQVKKNSLTQSQCLIVCESGLNKNKCGLHVDCNEVLSYNYNNNLSYRISSAIDQEYLLYIRQNNGIETVYKINDFIHMYYLQFKFMQITVIKLFFTQHSWL